MAKGRRESSSIKGRSKPQQISRATSAGDKKEPKSQQISAAEAMRHLEQGERQRERAVKTALLLLSTADVLNPYRPGGAKAKQIVEAVLSWMVGSIAPTGALARLAQMARQTDLQTHGLRRERAIEAIKMMARFHANDAAVKRLAKFIVREDPELAGIQTDIPAFKKKLARYDEHPKGKKGKASAETIIAEIIFEERDALGLHVRDGANETDEIERIRDRLVRDRRKRSPESPRRTSALRGPSAPSSLPSGHGDAPCCGTARVGSRSSRSRLSCGRAAISISFFGDTGILAICRGPSSIESC